MKSLSPRPPLPLSATLTKEEAATIIQSFFRGYLARREGKAQLFRTWQRKVWEERRAVNKIKTFWKSKQSPTHQKPSETDRTQEGDEVGNVEECEKEEEHKEEEKAGSEGGTEEGEYKEQEMNLSGTEGTGDREVLGAETDEGENSITGVN